MSANNGTDLGEDSLKIKAENVEIAIGQKAGKVVLRFFRPIPEVHFDPVNAVEIARQMIDIAVACGAKVTIEVPKRKITKAQRDKLVTRATHVFRSLSEKGRAPAYIAKHVVDTILSDVD